MFFTQVLIKNINNRATNFTFHQPEKYPGYISETRYFDNGNERYMFAYIIRTYKNNE